MRHWLLQQCQHATKQHQNGRGALQAQPAQGCGIGCVGGVTLPKA
jgi:hypothetical protein